MREDLFLNTASALLKQVISLQDYETWSNLRKHYLPSEYHTLFSIIEKHCGIHHKLPSFDELKYEIRDATTKNKLFLVEAVDVEVDAKLLLQYLKNEFAQKEILDRLDVFIDQSIAFESAEESVEHLHQIVLDVEQVVELQDPQESMQRITLFENEDDLKRYVPLGLNSEYDEMIQFTPRDLILIGGKRGSGKSVTSANIAEQVYKNGKTAIYFTIEMDSRSTLQRICSIATGVSHLKIAKKNLSVTEWQIVAKWWSDRFTGGEEFFSEYLEHRSFDKLHSDLAARTILKPDNQIHVVYDPHLTLSKINSELDKIMATCNPGVIIVDYINQVSRGTSSFKGGQYDWTEQIEISKALKRFAQDYEVPVVSPYQIDSNGEARFAKGILDAADAAYTLNPWTDKDECITFDCVKMRNNPALSFTSVMNWETLKIGPTPALSPKERKEAEESSGTEDNPPWKEEAIDL